MNSFQAKNRSQWRDWLKRNHNNEKEIWLVYYIKHTGKQSIAYNESVEEAICFGWIDGIIKKIDNEKYSRRFTPRKTYSKWSPLNINLAKKMIKEKKMTSTGAKIFEQRKEYDKIFLLSRVTDEISLSTEFELALKSNKNAWENFTKLAPGYKKQYICWLANAKKEETKRKRLKEAIKLLEQNQKLGMK